MISYDLAIRQGKETYNSNSANQNVRGSSIGRDNLGDEVGCHSDDGN